MNLRLWKKDSIIFTLLLLLLFGEDASAQPYSVIDLGTLPGGTNSQAYAISNDGVVVGVSDAASDANYSGCGSAHASKPFIWTATGGMQALEPSPVHDTLGFRPCGGAARGINDQQAVVGYLDYGFAGSFRAFIWTAASGMLLIPSSVGSALDINNSGQVVGTSGASAFRWTASAGFESLGIPAQNSHANAINNVGQVAGSAGAVCTGPVIWNAAGQPQDLALIGLLATLPPFTFFCSGAAWGINDAGVAVGSVIVGFQSGEGGTFAFKRIAQSDQVQPLGELSVAGSRTTEAYSINSAEMVVGTSKGRAFLWTPSAGIQDLNSLLDESGSGWTLVSANAINETGQIVGYGLHNGENRAFILTRRAPVVLRPGDLIVADANPLAAGQCCTPGAIVRIDPSSGTRDVLTSGENLVTPMGLALHPDGGIIVVDRDLPGAVRVEPTAPHTQSVLAQGGLLRSPVGVAVNQATGEVIVADAAVGLFRLTASGIAPIASIPDIWGVAIESGGSFIVAARGVQELLRITPVVGGSPIIEPISSGGLLNMGPIGVALDRDGTIVVGGGSHAEAPPGSQAVVRINPSTHAQASISPLVAGTGSFVNPFWVAIEATGSIIVSDQEGGALPRDPVSGLLPGQLFRVNPSTGEQTPITNGRTLGDPTGIVVIPDPAQPPPPTPALSVTPSSLDFGFVVVGTTKDVAAKIKNSGAGTLMGSAAVGSPFSIVSGSPFSLGDGQSQDVTLRFGPSSAGDFISNLNVTSNGGSASVQIRGQGNRPPTLSGLAQFRQDGKTPIEEGGTTGQSTVVFKASVSDSDGDQVRLEIELRQMGEPFAGAATPETISALVPSGTQVAISRTGLDPASYHWRARAVDGRGGASAWIEFGATGNTDFTIAGVAVPPGQTGRCSPPESVFADNSAAFGLVEGTLEVLSSTPIQLVTALEIASFQRVWLTTQIVTEPSSGVSIVSDGVSARLFDLLGMLPPRGSITYRASWCLSGSQVRSRNAMTTRSAFVTSLDFIAAAAGVSVAPAEVAKALTDIETLITELVDLVAIATELKAIAEIQTTAELLDIPIRVARIGVDLFKLASSERQVDILRTVLKRMGINITKAALKNLLTGATILDLLRKLADEIVIGIQTKGDDMVVVFK